MQLDTPRRKRVALYVRVSPPEQAGDDNIAAQLVAPEGRVRHGVARRARCARQSPEPRAADERDPRVGEVRGR